MSLQTAVRDQAWLLAVWLAALLASLTRAEQGVFGFSGKDVQPEALGDFLAHSDAAGAVTVRIEPRREDADAPFAGDNHQDTAAHAALGGDAYVESPLTGGVVHAAGMHHAQHFSDVAEGVGPLSGYGVHAAVRQRRCHYREIPAGALHCALPQVEGEDHLYVPRDHALAAHEVGRSAIPVRRAHLGLEGVLAHPEALVSGIDPERAQYAFKLLCGVLAPHQVGRHERPGVDHGIIRSVVPLVEDDGVESVPAGLHPNVF